MDKRVPPLTETFVIYWRWADENHCGTAQVRATTAPRAISKFKKDLARTFDYEANDLIIKAAYPERLFG